MARGSDYTPNDDRFNRREATGTPLFRAVEELGRLSSTSLEEMEQLTLGEIYQMAEAAYGDELPEFWRIWADWNRPDQVQPMGDL